MNTVNVWLFVKRVRSELQQAAADSHAVMEDPDRTDYERGFARGWFKALRRVSVLLTDFRLDPPGESHRDG